ncbi:MAG: 2-C-methyl-D-erythritol 2,4-cyclodiphosphate synthase [Candidatus Caldatribacteriaceae bacterium]
MRVGVGYDIHPLVAGEVLVLGGVIIPCEKGLRGYSDGDVLCHAIMDSLLGASGLPDIGQWFPPGDPSYRKIRSVLLLGEVCKVLRDRGWRIQNVDSTVIAEQPKIAPFVPAMKQELAQNMGVEIDAIGIKATTNEGLGSIGRGEGISCFAVSLIFRDG